MHKYDDIIDLPHPVSHRRAGMTDADRAAQFSPFAALTGYEETIEESGRLTDSAVELTESSIQDLNDRLTVAAERCAEKPLLQITYFRPDSRKSGGSYVTVTGYMKKIDQYEGVLLLTDGTQIPLKAIFRLEGELF